MSISRRELILDNVEDTLKLITKSGGYENNLVNVQRWKQKGNPKEIIPCAIISAGVEEDSPGPYPQVTATFSVFIEIFTRQDDDDDSDTDTILNSLLLDVEKAIAVDYTRGGYAEDSNIRRKLPFETVEGNPYCGLIIELEVLYKYKREDPALYA